MEALNVEEFVLYGEYYGSNVRTNYGVKGSFVFYDAIDLSNNQPKGFTFLKSLNDVYKSVKIPLGIIFKNAGEAIKNLPVDYDEADDYIKQNLIARNSDEFEGWVIQELNGPKDFWRIKHKTLKFSEVDPSKIKSAISDFEIGDDFRITAFLTENRVHNILSHGVKFNSQLSLAEELIADAEKESGIKLEQPKRMLSVAMPLVRKMNLSDDYFTS